MKNTSVGKVVKNSIIYSLTGSLMKCFMFFLVPLYTVYLTTEDFGTVTLAHGFISVMSFIVALSLFSAVNRFYVELRDTPEQLSRFYGTIISFTILSASFCCFLIYCFREYVTSRFFLNMPFFPVVCIVLVTLVFSCLHNIFDIILKSQQKGEISAITSLAYFLVTVFLNIVFIVFCHMGAVGMLLATLISTVIYVLGFVVYMTYHHFISWCLDLRLLWMALKYSIPIMPHNLSTHIADFVAKWLIGDVVSISGLGVYAIASQFGGLADTVNGYVSNAYQPWLYEVLHAKKGNKKELIRKVSRLMMSVIGFLFVGMSLFAYDYIVLLINHAYVDAWKYVPFVIAVFAIKIPYYFYVSVLFYHQKAARLIFIATVSSSLTDVIFSFYFVKLYGVFGIILAHGLSMFLRVSIVIWMSNKFEDTGLKLRDFIVNLILVFSVVGIGLMPAFYYNLDTFNWVNFGYKIVVCLAYGSGICFMYKEYMARVIKLIRGKVFGI